MTDSQQSEEQQGTPPKPWRPDPPAPPWLRASVVVVCAGLAVWCLVALLGVVEFSWPLLRQTLAALGLLVLAVTVTVTSVRRLAARRGGLECSTCNNPRPHMNGDSVRCLCWWERGKPTNRDYYREVGGILCSSYRWWWPLYRWWIVAGCVCLLLAALFGGTVVTRWGREHRATLQYRSAAQSFTALEECAGTLRDTRAEGETLLADVPTDRDNVMVAAERAVRLNLTNQEYVTAAICVVESMRDAQILLYESRAADLGNTVRETGRRAYVRCRHQRDWLADMEADLWERERRWRSFERLTVGFGEAELSALDLRNSGAVFATLADWPVLPVVEQPPFWGAPDTNSGYTQDTWVVSDPDEPWNLTVNRPTKEETRVPCTVR